MNINAKKCILLMRYIFFIVHEMTKTLDCIFYNNISGIVINK